MLLCVNAVRLFQKMESGWLPSGSGESRITYHAPIAGSSFGYEDRAGVADMTETSRQARM
jgi:hypothetical protein